MELASFLQIPIALALALLVTTAAVYDWRFRRIPNWVTAGGVVAGLTLNACSGGPHGLRMAALGLLLGFVVYLPLHLLKGMGAGDVKLMAAVGAITGPGNWFEVFLGTALIGGAAAALYSLSKGRFNETCCNLLFIVKDLARLRPPHRNNPHLTIKNEEALRMPHGVSIAIGTIAFLLAIATTGTTLSGLLITIGR